MYFLDGLTPYIVRRGPVLQLKTGPKREEAALCWLWHWQSKSRLFAVLVSHCIIKQRTGLGRPRILTYTGFWLHSSVTCCFFSCEDQFSVARCITSLSARFTYILLLILLLGCLAVRAMRTRPPLLLRAGVKIENCPTHDLFLFGTFMSIITRDTSFCAFFRVSALVCIRADTQKNPRKLVSRIITFLITGSFLTTYCKREHERGNLNERGQLNECLVKRTNDDGDEIYKLFLSFQSARYSTAHAAQSAPLFPAHAARD